MRFFRAVLWARTVTSAVEGASWRVVKRVDVFTFHILIDSKAGTTARVGRVRVVVELEGVWEVQRIFEFGETITPRVDEGE
jgi:hypothetical protein